MSDPHDNLLASASPATMLPADPAAALLSGLTKDDYKDKFLQIVKDHPDSSLCWALLAEGSLKVATLGGDLAGYAYARTGYHRGLDALRRSGWKGSGPIPWEHEPNRGFLRALWTLSKAAEKIGDMAESERCRQFLRDSSPTGFDELTGRSAT
ncbi:MAG: DUF3151 domain-containing protein [Propionibacteriaceae bacterium]